MCRRGVPWLILGASVMAEFAQETGLEWRHRRGEKTGDGRVFSAVLHQGCFELAGGRGRAGDVVDLPGLN